MKRNLLAASLFVFVLMTLVPPALLLISSAFVEGEFSLSRYEEILSEEEISLQIELQLHTFAVGLGAIAISLLLGLPAAFLLSRVKFPGRPILGSLCLLPLLIPPYLAGIAWTRVFDLSGYLGVVFMLGVSYFPIPAFLVARSLASVDRGLEEAAVISRGWGPTWWRITWRLCTPAILASSLFVFVIAVSDTGTADYFTTTTSQPFNVYATHVFFEFTKSSEAAAVAAVPLVMVAALGVIVISALEGKGSFQTLGGTFRAPSNSRVSRRAWPAFASVILLIAGLTLFPLVVFWNWVWSEPVLAPDGVLKNAFVSALEWAGPDLTRSTCNAIGAALLVLVVGFGPAYWLARLPRSRRSWGTLLTLIPFSIPAVALAIGYIRLFNHGDVVRDTVYTGQSLVVIGLAARFLPLGVLCLGTAIARVDTRLEEASLLGACGGFGSFTRVLLPLISRGVAFTGLLVFLFSMRELDTISLFQGGNDTIVIRIFNGIHWSQDALVAAYCLWLLIATSLPLLLGYLLLSGRQRPAS